jgi:hypothetical protein
MGKVTPSLPIHQLQPDHGCYLQLKRTRFDMKEVIAYVSAVNNGAATTTTPTPQQKIDTITGATGTERQEVSCDTATDSGNCSVSLIC